jgi:hypothetical protein
MNSLNSLLIGFISSYHTVIVNRELQMGSWTRDQRSCKENRKKKIRKSFAGLTLSEYFLCFFFPSHLFLIFVRQTNNGVFFSNPSICSQIHQHIRTLVCCLLCPDKRQTHIVKNIGSRLGKCLPLKRITVTVLRVLQNPSLSVTPRI